MTELWALPSVALADGEGDRISVGGVEIMFKSPADNDESWTVLDYKLPPYQFGAPLHYHHKLIETFYILSGEVWFQLGDKELTLGPGGFVLASPGTPHSFANRTGEPARMLAHASHSDHKKFLSELFRMIQSEAVWPPQDPRAIIELGRRYDTVYL